MEDWDPIGVSRIPEAHDEYDGYVMPIFGLLARGASDAELADYLYKTETETMGLMRLGMRGHLKKVIHKLREIDVRVGRES